MTRQIPAERPLPRKQEILERVLAEDAPARRRGWVVPVAAAASVAVVAGGLLAITSQHDTQQPDRTPVAGASSSRPSQAKPAGPKDVQINLGPLSAAETTKMVDACLRETGQYGPPHNGKAGAITHGIRVKGWNRTNPTEQTVAFVDESTGLLNACVGQPAKAPNGPTGSGVTGGAVGGDPAAGRILKSVFNPTDATHPAVPTDNGGSYLFVEFDKSPDLLVRDAWYRTDDRVAAIRQRYVIKGRTGPWYVANASDGLVFLRSWDSAVLQKGDVVRIETQVLGRNGELLDAPADQKGGGGLTPSPGTTRVDIGRAAAGQAGGFGTINFDR
jgi:hypothetical protein